MKIALIAPTPPDINAFGIRTISSVLKKEGYSTKIIFLPGGIEHLRFDGSYVYHYGEKALGQISDLCRDADLIGFSFMSQYFDRAVQVTDHLKKDFKDKPVIWGGTHPTCRPEESLAHCDIVCNGEGEHAVTELVEKMARGEDFTDTKGCWFKTPAGIKKNGPNRLVEDLDSLPFVDYDLENHYVYHWRSEDIIPVDREIMERQFPKLLYFKNRYLVSYRTMTSRGCPHRCSYCASSSMMKLRRRSVANVIEELEAALRKFPAIEQISFFDDTYFAAPAEYFEEFRDKYKKRIGLPFHAQCSPTTITERKMELLVDAGLVYTEMGIQTGSERIKKMYRRVVSNERMIEAAALITKYKDRMLMPDYHVILDNPWETKEDVLDTLKLLLKLPGKYNLQISSLIFFPGTELNDRARAEGILKDELNEVCRKPFTFPKATYLNYLIALSGFPAVPRRLLGILGSKPFVSIFESGKPSRFYEILFALTGKVRILGKGVAALLRGDFKRIVNFFRLPR
ncbi:MAG: B12-binding domain-containing radical SAM protein [Deltaproteobacteria bacterium]|nr:B12-binding domain-containing radical SAM protein [Deltaproteobacteria bacterium]